MTRLEVPWLRFNARLFLVFRELIRTSPEECTQNLELLDEGFCRNVDGAPHGLPACVIGTQLILESRVYILAVTVRG